jgi:hypothetical protein
MTIKKKDIAILICEIACCLIGGIPARIVITVVKNLVRVSDKSITFTLE